MNDALQDEKETSAKGYGWSWLFWLPMIVALYALSSGPMMMISKQLPGRSISASQVLETVYSPLLLAYEETSLHTPLGLYWHLWNRRHFDGKGNTMFK